MRRGKILRRLVEMAPPQIDAECAPGPHCVLSTTIGQMVLADFGIEATPYPVQLDICNAAWIAWAQEEYVGGQTEQLARGAHLLTNRPDWKGATLPSLNPVVKAPWDGHLVLRVGDDLVDLNLGAFNRPTKAIAVPDAAILPCPDGTASAEWPNPQTLCYYRPLVAPYADEYQTARDWVERGRFADLVARISRRVRRGG